jgi:sentrin-specific protease 1
VINLQDHRFEYYDSFIPDIPHQHQVFANLRKWIKSESLYKLNKDFDLSGWTNYAPGNIPLQNNYYDCGVFVIKYAECLALGLSLEALPFGSQHMPLIRRRAILELLNLKLHVTLPRHSDSGPFERSST